MGDLQARPVNQPQRGENLAGRGNRRTQDSCQGIGNSRSRHPQDEKPRKRAVFRGRVTIRPGGKAPPLPAPPPSKKTATDSPGAICSTEPSKPPMAAPVLEDSVGRNPADRPASCLTRFSGKEPCPSAMCQWRRQSGPLGRQNGGPPAWWQLAGQGELETGSENVSRLGVEWVRRRPGRPELGARHSRGCA